MVDDSEYTKFGYRDYNYKDVQWRDIRIVGIEYIFQVLCLIVEIMIYRLPVRDSIDDANVRKFREKLKQLKD